MNDKLIPIRRHLQAQTTLVLSTVGENHKPRSTPLFYVTDKYLNFYWFSSRSSVHSRNCALNPEASISIFADVQKWRLIRGVQMQGIVALVTDRLLRKSVTSQYIEHFALGNLFSLAIPRNSLYSFTPRWIRYLDNSKRFGYKMELNLPIPVLDDKPH